MVDQERQGIQMQLRSFQAGARQAHLEVGAAAGTAQGCVPDGAAEEAAQSGPRQRRSALAAAVDEGEEIGADPAAHDRNRPGHQLGDLPVGKTGQRRYGLPGRAGRGLGLAFLFHNSVLGRVVAFYPGPAGATESELPLDAWTRIVETNPCLLYTSPSPRDRS